MTASNYRLSRRATLAGCAAAFLPAAAPARAACLPYRQILSVNMRSDEQTVIPVPQTATYTNTLPLETGATAIRIGIGNTTPHTFTLGGICVTESREWEPSTRRPWSYISFSGDLSETVHPPAQTPQPVTVPGDTGYFNVPRITWSDWIDFRTTSGGHRPQLLLRTLVPAQELVLMAFPAGPGVYSEATPDQPERFAAQAWLPGDYVTNPNQPMTAAFQSKHTPIYVIQFRSLVPGRQFVIGGDSHLAMSQTFAVLAATALSTPAAPISVWNTAWAAKSSNTFWPALDQAIKHAPPSLTVIQGWTANDGMNPVSDEAYLGRVRESAARTFAEGGLPVIVKPLPRDLFGKPELATWQAISQQLDTLVPGALVFDPGPYVYNPAMPGNYLPGLSDDDIHPNTSGNFRLRDPFIRLIKPFLG